MQSVVHCLGELEHIYDKHNLKLRTNGCITLSSSQSSHNAFSSNLLNVQDLDAFISSGTWTGGANRLRLHVELLFDDIAVSGSSVSQATEEIGIVLCNAELWSQLCLDASLTILDSNKFLIYLSAQSSNADIRPPRCIPSVYLEDIVMKFHFSTCRRTRNASRTQVVLSESGIQHTFASTNPVDEHLDRRYYSRLSSLGEPQGILDTLTDRYAPWVLGASGVGASPVSSQGSVSSNTHSTSSLDSPTARQMYAIQEAKSESLVLLVGSSLRRMMSDYRPVRPGGVVLSSDAGCPKLAAISPALFSPGYAKAVSQRTGLLPTIARTVSRVYRRTSSNRLRHRLRLLQELSPCSCLDHGSTEDSDPSSALFSSSVEARLWFLTRSKLIDPFACRGLKSLSTSTKPGFGPHEMLDDSLDDSLDDAADVMLDGDEAPVFDAPGDAMDLDEASRLENFQEHSLDKIADEEEEPLDDDLFWEHSQDEVAYDGEEILEDDSISFMHDDSCAKFCRAFAIEAEDDVVC